MKRRDCRHRKYNTDDNSGLYICNKCGECFDFCTKCGEIVPQDVFAETGGYCSAECVNADDAEGEGETELLPTPPAPVFFGSVLALPPPDDGANPLEDAIKSLIGELLGGGKKKTVDVKKRKRDEFLPSQEEVEQDREKGSFKIRKILGETSGLYLVEWDDGEATWEPLEAIQSSKVYQTWRV